MVGESGVTTRLADPTQPRSLPDETLEDCIDISRSSRVFGVPTDSCQWGESLSALGEGRDQHLQSSVAVVVGESGVTTRLADPT
jgi:hypothetical protein